MIWLRDLNRSDKRWYALKDVTTLRFSPNPDMLSKEKKKRRREIVKSIRAHEHAQAEAGRSLDKRVLRELLAHLERSVFVRLENGQPAVLCDHTLKHTKKFLQDLGVWQDELVEWLGEYGGYCDCEVAYNVFEYWTPERLAE